jgi:hypothetical protein
MRADLSWPGQRVGRVSVTGCRVLPSSTLVAVSVAVIAVRVLIRDRRFTSWIRRAEAPSAGLPGLDVLAVHVRLPLPPSAAVDVGGGCQLLDKGTPMRDLSGARCSVRLRPGSGRMRLSWRDTTRPELSDCPERRLCRRIPLGLKLT